MTSGWLLKEKCIRLRIIDMKIFKIITLFFFVVLCFHLTSNSVYANIPDIQGYVQVQGTNTPVAGVWVKLTNSASQNSNCVPGAIDQSRYALTDANGKYTFVSWTTAGGKVNVGKMIDTNLDGVNDAEEYPSFDSCDPTGTPGSIFACGHDPFKIEVIRPYNWNGTFDKYGDSVKDPCIFCLNNGTYVYDIPVTLYYHPPAPTNTPTPTPTRTPTPTPITNLSCNQTCTGSSQCGSGYCYLGVCRNISCPAIISCNCSGPTFTPTQTTTPTPTLAYVAPVSCVAYGVQDWNTSDSQLIAYDLDAKTAIAVGPIEIGYNFEGIDIDPVTNTVYAIRNSSESGIRGMLYKIDAQNGNLVRIGATGINAPRAMSFRSTDDSLWTWASKGLYQINKDTASSTLVYPYTVPVDPILGRAVDHVEGIVWNNDGTLLYALKDNYSASKSELWVYNPLANTFTKLTDNISWRTEALDIRPDGYLMMGTSEEAGVAQIKAYDVSTLQYVNTIEINTPYKDIESIAWPASCGNPVTSMSCSITTPNITLNGVNDINNPGALVSVNNQSGGTIDNIQFSVNTPINAEILSPNPDTAASYQVQFQATAVGSTTYKATATMKNGLDQCSATANLTVTNALPWWQTKGSDAISGQNIKSIIPATCLLPSCISSLISSVNPDSTGIAIAGGTIDVGSGSFSSPYDWSAISSYADTLYNTSYFTDKARNIQFLTWPAASTSITAANAAALISGTQTSGYYYVKYTGNTTLTIDTDLDLGTNKVVLLVENADVTLNKTIHTTDGQGLFMLVAKGDIHVSNFVSGSQINPALEGIFFTNQRFYTGTGGGANDQPLHIRGSVVAFDKVVLERNLSDNSQSAAETFEWTPDTTLLFPPEFGHQSINWVEAAP